MIDRLKARLRPGSTGEATSKVDTTGREISREAVAARSGRPAGVEIGTQNWPAGSMTYANERAPAANEATPMPRHDPDDPEVLRRVFRLEVPDI